MANPELRVIVEALKTKDGQSERGYEALAQASVVNLEGRTVDDSRIMAFRSDLRGKLLRPSDEGYEASRRIWNGMIDKHPGLIAKCAGPSDVMRAVKFARENDLLVADLFWGLRGGGGNFGIVTSFEYKVHPLSAVLGGMVLFEIGKAREVLRFYNDFSRECPDELTMAGFAATAPDGNPVVAIIVCYSGDLQEGERVIKPIRNFDSPIADLVKPIRYTEMQRIFDTSPPAQPGFLN